MKLQFHLSIATIPSDRDSRSFLLFELISVMVIWSLSSIISMSIMSHDSINFHNLWHRLCVRLNALCKSGSFTLATRDSDRSDNKRNRTATKSKTSGTHESMEAVPMILPGPVIRKNHSSKVSSLMSVITNTKPKRKENLASERITRSTDFLQIR